MEPQSYIRTYLVGERTTGWRRALAAGATLWITLLFLILPLKFGTLLDSTGIGFCPLSLIEWIFVPWPSSIAPGLTGVALLIVLGHSPDNIRQIFRPSVHLAAPSMVLLAVSFLGLPQTTEREYAGLFLGHALAAVNLVLAVRIHLDRVPRSRILFLHAIAVGAMFTIVSGYNQLLYGMEETKRLAMELASQHGQTLSVEMLDRLNQTRAYATFAYPNSFAAHLVLTMPILVYAVSLWSRNLFHSTIAQLVPPMVTSILALNMVWHTGSRGAVVAFAAALLLFSVWRFADSRPRNTTRTLILAVGLAVILLGCAIFLYVASKERSLSSVRSRADYYLAAMRMFTQHPLVGVGLGEFFPWYLRLKPPMAEETRLAHSFFLHFLSQCGLFGGIAATYFLLQPILIYRLARTGRWQHVSQPLLLVIVTGCGAWNAHSLMDFNLQIPGTFMTAACLPLLLIEPGREAEVAPAKRRIFPWIVIPLCGALAGTACLSRLAGARLYQELYNRVQAGTDARELTDDLQRVAAEIPTSPYPWALVGRQALGQRQYQLAEAAFREATARTPHRASFHALRAQALLALGQFDAAGASIRQAIEWYPHQQMYRTLQQRIAERRQGR